jgi:hypothetical protein
MKPHGLKENECIIQFYNDLYRVFVGDGAFFCKEVWVNRTKESCESYCQEHNLKTRNK